MIRVVKMTFQKEKVNDFLANFNANKTDIRGFDGVEYLELLKDKNNPHVFFTYSVWESEAHLENYRKSDLFKSVWSKTKPLFSEPAEAWSMDSITQLT